MRQHNSKSAYMTSKARSQNKFLYPETSQEAVIQEDATSKGRQATVYDAVAGRVSATGFIPNKAIISSTRDTASSSASAVPPEAVLFRRKNAPTRYVESDIYFANEQDLRIDLPESDLLKALHCYTSDFYSRATADDGTADYQSMDETALIALGVLMEEAARDILGQTGDLVFTEREEIQESPGKTVRASSISSNSAGARPSKKRRLTLEGQSHTMGIDENFETSWR